MAATFTRVNSTPRSVPTSGRKRNERTFQRAKPSTPTAASETIGLAMVAPLRPQRLKGVRWLGGAHERPHHPPADLPRQHVRVETRSGEKRPGVLEGVYAGRLDRDLAEPARRE